MSSFDSFKRTAERPRSSYDDIAVVSRRSRRAVAIQCQFCPGQTFRRSTLRTEDFRELLLMRYPVRCLRCSQRQLVSFTIASISVPSHVRQRQLRREETGTNWREPNRTSSSQQPDK